MKSFTTLVTMLCAASLLIVAQRAIAVDNPDLSGHWKLNKELSDNPKEKMSGAERGSRGDFGMGGGGMHGGARGGSGMHGGMQGGHGGAGRPGSDPFGIANDEITITQSATSVVITGGEHERVLRTDGKVDLVDTPRGGQIAISSRWDGDSFVVTMKDEMRKSTETWRIDPESHRLIVTTEIDRGEGSTKMTIRRVWDRLEETKPAP